MKKSVLISALLAAMGVAAQAQAGVVAVPAAGFATSAYTNCYNTGRTAADPKGNFGQYPFSAAQLPSATVNSTCWVTKPALEVTLPTDFGTGYTLVGSRSVAIPTTTGGTGNIGTLVDYAWRNSATNMCVIGTRVTMAAGADHDSGTAGIQLFEVNDIARGGFSASGTVNIGYTMFSTTTNTSPVFRVGRTFTSVQHRALKYGNLTDAKSNGTNYLDLPTKNTFSGAINGETTGINGTTAATTTAATQDALVNANYVDFTVDAVATDDDQQTNALSAFTYIQAPCTANPTLQNNAIRLRQTAQENTTQKSIDLQGYAIGAP